MSKTEKIKLVTPEFRGSYVHLVTPHKVDKDDEKEEPKYSITVVLPKKDPNTVAFLKKLRAAIATEVTAKNGKPIPETALKHFPIQDGDLGTEDAPEGPFPGCWTFRCSNKFKPEAVDENGNKMFNTEQLYSGAWFRVCVSIFFWSNPKFGKGVSINLLSVLKVKDDEAFGGGSKAKDDFSEFIKEDGGDAGTGEGDEF